MAAHNDITPDTRILDDQGRDWAWCFVVFRDVPDFPGYCVGSDGSVWSRRQSPRVRPEYRWRLLKPWPNRDGHLAYGIYLDGKIYHRFGHQLVLTAFIGQCPPGMECCHNDGNPAHNNILNLRWDTKKANAEDCIRHGRRPRGEEHGRAKIRASDVPEIRRLVSTGRSKASIGRTYGVSAQQIRQIATRRQWKHIG